MKKRVALDPWVTWTDDGLELLENVVAEGIGKRSVEEGKTEELSKLIILEHQVKEELKRRGLRE